MILGPNGCGKTSKIIKPCIWQDLVEIKNKRLKLQLLKAVLNRKANIKIYKIKAMDIDKDKKIELIQKVLDKRDKSSEYFYTNNLACSACIIGQSVTWKSIKKSCGTGRLNKNEAIFQLYFNSIESADAVQGILLAAFIRTVLRTSFSFCRALFFI